MIASPHHIIERIKASSELVTFLETNIDCGRFDHAYEITDRWRVLKTLKKFKPDHRWARGGGWGSRLIIYFEHENDLVRFKMMV